MVACSGGSLVRDPPESPHQGRTATQASEIEKVSNVFWDELLLSHCSHLPSEYCSRCSLPLQKDYVKLEFPTPIYNIMQYHIKQHAVSKNGYINTSFNYSDKCFTL